MTDLVLLTGFLGAGKTTLLKRLMDAMKDRKLAVVSNDFGPINVDSQLLEEGPGPTLEITGGSLFCTCRSHEFVEGLRMLSEHPLDVILVESSGLGDPANMGALISEAMKFWPELRYLGSVTVADLENLEDSVDLLPAVERQVQLADVIIGNKEDLVDEETLHSALQLLGRLNTNASVLVTSHCDIDVPTVMQLLNQDHQASFGETSNRGDTRLPTSHLVTDGPVDPDKLREFLTAIAPATLRIKGFLRAPDGWSEVSCVGPSVEIHTRPNAPEREGLVMIALEEQPIHLDAMLTWERVSGSPVRIT